MSRGLSAAGVAPTWLTRPLRVGEAADLPAQDTRTLFYRLTDGPRRRQGKAARLLKGVEHAAGLAAALRLTRRMRPDVVHLQWAVLPFLDRIAIRRLRRHAPVVVTVHDATPFNGKQVSVLQRGGFARALAAADRLIVHTDGAKEQLAAAGLPAERIDVVPHGLLGAAIPDRAPATDGRWRIVQFGRIQHYKGVDLLVEALGRIDPATRARIKVVVAGEAQVETAPLIARAAALGLGEAIDFRFGFLSKDAMGALLASADAFVFPYRTIEASGVLHLVAGLRRWIVASDTGAFPALVGRDGAAGALVDPTDADALAAALIASIGREPSRAIDADVPDWATIGRLTREVYARARADWVAHRHPGHVPGSTGPRALSQEISAPASAARWAPEQVRGDGGTTR
ncbi:glycosyltransferase [Sphingomonas sp. BK069]|uniref:glycosyltransferase n=1 Tax=Sphingomonas sp. BK069 TaxID=2586979 RepID=UPI001609943C|nr:glycosyltransferase [Sphingomonas sp. BK069]MBB3348843.1 glycosyltransferase involved in cell wall biosynthesis [Sphingomonas sp. BK069]